MYGTNPMVLENPNFFAPSIARDLSTIITRTSYHRRRDRTAGGAAHLVLGGEAALAGHIHHQHHLALEGGELLLPAINVLRIYAAPRSILTCNRLWVAAVSPCNRLALFDIAFPLHPL